MEKETLDLLRVLEDSAAVLSQKDAPLDSEDNSSKKSSKKSCVDALNRLGKLEMTKTILGTTQAGKRLRAISKQSGDDDVSRLSRALVSRWKAMVMAESSHTTNTTVAGVGTGKECPPTNNGDARDTVAAETSTHTADEKSRTPLTLTGDTIRDKIRNNLFDALSICRRTEHVDVGGEPGTREAELACSIELSMFSSLDGVSANYKAKFRQLYFNLKDPKNPDLRRRVVLGEFSPSDLLTASPEDLASDAKKEENQRIRDKKLFDSAPSSVKKATTDQFQCGKCRQRKCTYYQMQTRSADEPMTTFVQCTNCNNAWKFC